LRAFYDEGTFSFRWLFIITLVFFGGKSVLLCMLGVVRIRILTGYRRAMRERLYRQLLSSSFTYLRGQKIGRFDHIILGDLKSSGKLLENVIETVRNIFSVGAYALVGFSLSPVVAAVAFAGGTIFLLSWNPLFRRLRKYARMTTRMHYAAAHAISESLLGIKTIKALSVERQALVRVRGFFTETERIERKKDTAKLFAKLSVEPVSMVFVVLFFAFSYRFLAFNIATFLPLVYLIHQMFVGAGKIQSSFHVMSETLPPAERVADMIVQTRDKRETQGGTQPFSFIRELCCADVTFSYGGSLVLSVASLSFVPGEMVGIIGPSGAGKTTLVDLLLRLIEPTAGTLTLDGIPASEISLSLWRRQVIYVPQESFLIHGSIAENIRFFDETISPVILRSAAERAGLSALLARLPRGIDAPVGERGAALSGGEKQRITIARALARNPAILVLDEATSALDAEAEVALKDTLERLRGLVTVVIIAHRLTTIANADRIVALHNGRVVEEGSPAELRSRVDSYYSRALRAISA
jgi:ATP-binding cassette subfamily C protein